jgi:hypothetical protein
VVTKTVTPPATGLPAFNNANKPSAPATELPRPDLPEILGRDENGDPTSHRPARVQPRQQAVGATKLLTS